MRYRGKFDWYDFVILGFAAIIIYPDKVLQWIEERTGWTFGWLHLVVFEFIAVGLLAVTTMFLTSAYPNLRWWYPIIAIGVLGVIRLLLWFVTEFFDV